MSEFQEWANDAIEKIDGEKYKYTAVFQFGIPKAEREK